jgi:two-component system sensor kinase FixL
VREANGMASGYIGVATSITDRRRLERQLLDISEREQARIGQEVHDGLCQQLVSLAFDANALKTQLRGKNRPESAMVERLVKYLDISITEARRLARGLFPIRLETEGVSPAIEELLLNTGDRFGLTCQFEAEPLIIANTNIATNLYRIAQEALNNVVKHSRANQVRVKLRQRDGHVELRIEDNGIGMPGSRAESHPGMGLHIMDYRARNIGGSLQFESQPGGGTIICCLVPVPDPR